MVGTAKQKPHATDFVVMIDNAIKLPVELPGNNISRPFKRKGLIKKKSEQAVWSKFIFRAVNHHGLGFAGVPGDRKIFIDPVPTEIQTIESIFFYEKQHVATCFMIPDFKFHASYD